MDTSLFNLLSSIVFFITIFVGAFFVFRFVFLWYWKVNIIVSLLEEIRDKIK